MSSAYRYFSPGATSTTAAPAAGIEILRRRRANAWFANFAILAYVIQWMSRWHNTI